MNFKKREIPKGEGGNLFLRLKDGESIKGVCRGEIHEFHMKWVGNRSQLCEPNDPEAKFRFRLNIIVPENGSFVPKIWEFGLTIYNQLADIAEEYDLEKTKIKITRRGTGTDTVYLILPLLKEPLTPKQLNEIEAVPLNILEHKESAKQQLAPSSGSEYDELGF